MIKIFPMNDGTVSLCFPQFYGWRRTDIPHTHGNGFTLATGTGLKVSVIERLCHFLSFAPGFPENSCTKNVRALVLTAGGHKEMSSVLAD
jgi:hypothetical protein